MRDQPLCYNLEYAETDTITDETQSKLIKHTNEEGKRKVKAYMSSSPFESISLTPAESSTVVDSPEAIESTVVGGILVVCDEPHEHLPTGS